ncbi:hypothetical protein BGZ67_000630, partial [Mortierella alpina]
MGIVGLWPFIKKKGYEATLLHAHTVLNSTYQPMRHVDVQACFYSTISRAYSSHPVSVANHILERALLKFATPENAVVYLDGNPCQEKALTHASREKKRQDELDEVVEAISSFSVSIEEKRRVRKQLFYKINKGLKKAFSWTTAEKASFVAHLRGRGWRVVQSTTEADLEIALNYVPGDVVVSTDSDLLIYANILTVWRPISKDRFLVYQTPDILTTLAMTKSQFTAFGVVSANDYDRNIPSLGVATNYDLIKAVKSTDVKDIVHEYLENELVDQKNEENATFAMSIRVFVEYKQDIIEPGSASKTHALWKELQEQYIQLQTQYRLQKQEQK